MTKVIEVRVLRFFTPIVIPQIYGDEGDIDSDRHNVCEKLESERIFFVVQQGGHRPDPKHDDSADHIEGPSVLCTQKNIQHTTAYTHRSKDSSQ